MRMSSLIGNLIGCGILVSLTIGCTTPSDTSIVGLSGSSQQNQASPIDEQKAGKMETATFGGGCFWCVEAVFLQLEGVESVKSGYMGGEVAIAGNGGTEYSLKNVLPARYHPVSVFLNGEKKSPGVDFTLKRTDLVMAKPVNATDEFYVVVDNPTYEQVCSKTTGHAEVIQIQYDPSKVSFDVLLQVFWKTHDPTTLNRQGNDVGPQYRSAVFYHNAEQQEKAETYKKKLNEAHAYANPVVTEVTKATRFYEAEDYHQNYFNNNPGSGYCRLLIPPKLEKLKQVFGDKLKK